LLIIKISSLTNGWFWFACEQKPPLELNTSFSLLNKKLPQKIDIPSAVWQSREGGTHNFASPPCDGFALSSMLVDNRTVIV